MMATFADTLRPVVVDPVIETKCFCGKRLVIGHQGPKGELCMAHDVPACARYMRDEPAEKFLHSLLCYHRGLS
jgi:hypothetical protein